MSKIISTFKTLFLSYCVFLPCLLQAQKYFPLPDSGAVWTSAKIDTNGVYVENIKFLISSDTVIKGKTYKKVYSTVDSIINCPKMKYFGCIREDANQRWLTIMNKDTTVMTLYDFSLKVGDLVDIYICFPSPYGSRLKVVSIDSIYIYNGFRKRINLKTFGLYKVFFTSWVEGIGSLNQLFLPYVLMWNFDYKLICFEEKGVLKYLNSPNSNCYYVSISDNQNSKFQNAKVYPNPVSVGQNVQIDDLKPGTYHLAIMDLVGRNKAEYTFTSNGQITFIVGIKSGIYIVKINGPDNFYGYFKLMVE